MTPRDYARLHWNWYQDPVLCACAVQVPAALHLWPVLIAKAVHASHHQDNPTGAFTTSAAQLSMIVHTSPNTIEAALALLEEGELVSIERGKLGAFTVSLTSFDDWQVARGSDAKRQADRRDRKNASREKAPERHADITAPSPHRHPEEKREEEKREEPAASSRQGRAQRALPPTVVRTLELVRPIPGLSEWQIESNVLKAMEQFPSLPDDAICEAITAFENQLPEGKAIHSAKAWRLMQACFRVAGTKHTEATEAARPKRRRLLAEVIAEHDAFWETAS